jgi:protein-tyrosine phosphatase
MIDLHSHILPGVDDGAETLEDALAMARMAAADGTRVLCATPHVTTRAELAGAGMIPGRVAALQADIDAAGISLRLAQGAEVFPMDGIAEALEAGAPLTLGNGGRYMLVDLPFSLLPPWLGQFLFGLQTHNITPILAHPERVLPVQCDVTIIESYVRRGILLQVNAGSILGRHGAQAAETGLTLLRLHWAQFLASDAHSPRSRRPGLSAAVQILRAYLDEQEIADLTTNNGQRVLDGDPVPAHPGVYTPPAKRKSWWGWWRRQAS